MDFTGNGCESSNLNDVTSYFHGFLVDDGHAGYRFPEGAAYPQDWWEACSSIYESPGSTIDGIDDLYVDQAQLAVFAGHGHKGLLLFGTKRGNMCITDLGANSRLGSMAGNDVAVAMYLTSCTLATTHLVSDANYQWVRQQLGFHNSPQIANGDLGLVYVYTGAPYYYTNTYAWNEVLEENIAGDEVNSPIAVSYGVTLTDAQSVRDTAKVRTGTYMTARSGGPACGAGQPSFNYVYVIRNNGAC